MITNVILPGWGISHSIFNGLSHQKSYQIIDWSKIQSDDTHTPYSQKKLIASLHNLLSKLGSIRLIGWSLGGLLAIDYAKENPEQIDELVLIACNPCFVSQPDWPMGMSSTDFNLFTEQFKKKPEHTLKKFASLCYKTNLNSRQNAQPLFKHLITLASKQQHQNWIHLLTELSKDRRLSLNQINCPVLHILAANDHLVPASLASILQLRYPLHQIVLCKGSHTFFMNDLTMLSDLIIHWNSNK